MVRSFLIAGARHRVALVADPRGVPPDDVALAYGFFPTTPDGWTELGAPLLERRLRVGALPLLAPFGRTPRAGFREIAVQEPRTSRLWGRFSVDVPVALERGASFFAARVFDRAAYRVFIVEDGDRYAIRAMCVFTVRGAVGYVMELLHDRSVEGMRRASHVLGLALRAMSDDGAVVARAYGLPHSGTIPILLRHLFLRRREVVLAARVLDPDLAPLVETPERWYVSYLDRDDP